MEYRLNGNDSSGGGGLLCRVFWKRCVAAPAWCCLLNLLTGNIIRYLKSIDEHNNYSLLLVRARSHWTLVEFLGIAIKRARQ